jgi:hypothetical protein
MSNTKYVLKSCTLALAGSVLVFLGVGYLLADGWTVHTKRVIPADAAAIKAKVADLSSWFEWTAMDFQLGNPTNRNCIGNPGESGQRATWQGPMGVATLVLDAVEDDSVSYSISYTFGPDGNSFGGQFGGEIDWVMREGATEITWTETGKLDSMVQRWSNWFGALQEKVHQVQQASLSGLEENLRRSAKDKVVQPGK